MPALDLHLPSSLKPLDSLDSSLEAFPVPSCRPSASGSTSAHWSKDGPSWNEAALPSWLTASSLLGRLPLVIDSIRLTNCLSICFEPWNSNQSQINDKHIKVCQWYLNLQAHNNNNNRTDMIMNLQWQTFFSSVWVCYLAMCKCNWTNCQFQAYYQSSCHTASGKAQLHISHIAVACQI